MGVIALIDGDVLAYHACGPRWELAEDDDGNPMLDESDVQMRFTYTVAQDRHYLEKAWEKFKSLLTEHIEAVYAHDYLMAVKSPTNFRDDMYPEYKLHRKTKGASISTKFVPTIRKLAVAEGLAIEAHDREADDFLRIWANQVKLSGHVHIICSVDKDLQCIPGKHYNLKTRTFSDASEAFSTRFYYEQLLKGDPTDNIPGIPRIGDVKATKLLAGLDTEEEFQEAVVEAYMDAYDTEWRSYLLSNGKMIHLQSSINDYFNFNNWPVVRALETA